MTPWACGIVGCDAHFETAERLIRHQAEEHPPCECKVCGESLPAGYLAIRHAFEEHTRAEFVRAYDADSDAIRLRERLLDLIEGRVDVTSIMGQIEADDDPVASVGD